MTCTSYRGPCRLIVLACLARRADGTLERLAPPQQRDTVRVNGSEASPIDKLQSTTFSATQPLAGRALQHHVVPNMQYRLIGGGYCRRPVALPDVGSRPPLLYPSNPNHTLADADPVAECMNRCVAAFDDIMEGGVRAFYVMADAGSSYGRCQCIEGGCSYVEDSKYTAYERVLAPPAPPIFPPSLSSSLPLPSQPHTADGRSDDTGAILELSGSAPVIRLGSLGSHRCDISLDHNSNQLRSTCPIHTPSHRLLASDANKVTAAEHEALRAEVRELWQLLADRTKLARALDALIGYAVDKLGGDRKEIDELVDKAMEGIEALEEQEEV